MERSCPKKRQLVIYQVKKMFRHRYLKKIQKKNYRKNRNVKKDKGTECHRSNERYIEGFVGKSGLPRFK